MRFERGWSVWLFSPALLLIAVSTHAAEGDRVDMHSYAKPDQARVSHLALDLAVDFASKTLKGDAVLTVERPNAAVAGSLDLDTRDLAISGISTSDTGANWKDTTFILGGANPILGRNLTIKLPPGSKLVKIAYTTVPSASAVQWLDAKGTAGGKFPFLFTQSEAIHARSWIPLQDSPGVRITYTAKIHVPKGLTAVMSADLVSRKDDTFEFAMRQPISPYLIALAVGDLAFRPLGPTTGVYAEPSVVESARSELVDTQAMVKTIEARFGPYRWGRYDLLILPPSFPFGGMENPKLTFATPTILAGDRSLVSLVAHELAHSWSGNLVTNATWRDFWLNEGFTTYLERRVIEDLYSKERADMERVLGLRELRKELAEFPTADQILHINLAGRDPDDGMTRIPYEKGALLLTTLEHAFGRETFDAFLKGYFDHFAFQSIITEDFVSYLKAHLFPKNPEAAKTINLHAWIEEPGLPSGFPEPKSEAFVKIEAAVKAWNEGNGSTTLNASRTWSTHEWLHFLHSLPEKLTPDQMIALDKAFNFTTRGNAEIAQLWLVIAIRNNYKPADARLDTFLTTIGRRKFLMPLYTELLKTPEGARRARAIFDRARPFYHPIAADSVAKLLAKGQ